MKKPANPPKKSSKKPLSAKQRKEAHLYWLMVKKAMS
jgi:hypothetical protein